jgi:hypothetical protein
MQLRVQLCDEALVQNFIIACEAFSLSRIGNPAVPFQEIPLASSALTDPKWCGLVPVAAVSGVGVTAYGLAGVHTFTANQAARAFYG